ncbi:MAG: hypothetical protein WCX73_01830 [Candidatus Pacearchaeota archaeon]
MAFEKFRFKYNMGNFHHYTLALIGTITPGSPDAPNFPIVEIYSRRAVESGRKARDLGSKLGITLDENFTKALASAEGIYDSCVQYKKEIKMKEKV